MKTSTLLNKATKSPYVIVYSVTHLDYDGMTSSFHIVGAYDEEYEAKSAFEQLINDRKRKHLEIRSNPNPYPKEVYNHSNRKLNGVKYLERSGWLIEDGSGFNKIRGEASIIEKETGEEVLPAMFKGTGPIGLDDSDIMYFFTGTVVPKLK